MNEDRIGTYQTKPFTKYRKDIALLVHESWRKHSIYALVDFDVTNAKQMIRNIREETGDRISFTAWIVRCLAQALTEYKELNVFRQGRNKLIYFDDVDISVVVEREYKGEKKPLPLIVRKANEKDVYQITQEIRDAQQQPIDEKTTVLGQELSSFERFALGAPLFLKKIVIKMVRKRAFMKKRHMGTASVTSMGMIGHFPGWPITMGGASGVILGVGGMIKAPRYINGELKERQLLRISIGVDHDVIDGGNLSRLVDRLYTLFDEGFDIKKRR